MKFKYIQNKVPKALTESMRGKKDDDQFMKCPHCGYINRRDRINKICSNCLDLLEDSNGTRKST